MENKLPHVQLHPYFIIVIAVPILIACWYLIQMMEALKSGWLTSWVASNWGYVLIAGLLLSTPILWKCYKAVSSHQHEAKDREAYRQLLLAATVQAHAGYNFKYRNEKTGDMLELVNPFVSRSTRVQVSEDMPLGLPSPDDTLESIPSLPRIEQFYEAIPYNSLQTGMGAELVNGQLVLAPIRKSTHFKLIGGSGMGKSCVAAAILDIATTTNDADHLKIGLLDLEHNTSRLFEDLPHIAEIGPRRQRLVGRNADEVAQKLKLLQWELTRRSELGEEHCTLREPVILVYVEEMLALKYEVVDKGLNKEMLAAINILGVRGRKYGIFFLACMQTDYSDTKIREAMAQFRTRAGFAIDPDTARASGFFSTDLINQNFRTGRSGQYVLEKPAFSGIVLAPDYDVAIKLEALGATRQATTYPTSSTTPALINQPQNRVSEVDTSTTKVAPVVAATDSLTAQEWRIIEKWRGGMGLKAIIASEFTNGKGEPLTGGDAFTQRAKEIQVLMAKFLPRKEA